MNIKKQLEEQGKAPVLGWADNRKPGCGVNLYDTSIRDTFRMVREWEALVGEQKKMLFSRDELWERSKRSEFFA